MSEPNPFYFEDEQPQDPDLEQSLASAAAELLRRKKARSNLISFTEYTFPQYFAEPAHKLIAEKLDAVIEGKIKRLMIFAPPQHGKQIAHSTLVPTPTGFKTHGELKEGDRVFGRDGKPVKIVAISEETLATLEVEFSDRTTIKCHPNHEWLVHDYLNSNRREKVYETQEMMETGVRSGIERKRGNSSYFKIDTNVCVEYDQKQFLIHPYVLGVWLGDGQSSGGGINHAQSDQTHIRKIKSLGYEITRIEIHPKTGVVRTWFKRLHEELKTLGLINNKHIPEEYLCSSKEQRLELVAGLIDTDGCVCKRMGRMGLSNTNERIIRPFRRLVSSLGWRASVCSFQPCLSGSGVRGKKVVHQVSFNPDVQIPTALPRKCDHRIDTVRRKRSIVSIRKCEPEPGRCIQVDAEDGIYLVGETFIPTHNSELASVRFPAYWLGRRPNDPVIICSYGASLAENKSRQARQVVESKEYELLFKGLTTNPDSRSISEWHINGGRGYLIAAGVSGAITGKGAMLGLIDDPIKDWEEAQSETIREKCWDWYRTTFLTRIWEKGALVLIQTRWHEDDLAGRILKSEGKDWEVIRLPAIAENQYDRDENNRFLGLPEGELDPLNRLAGEPLCPKRYSLAALETFKRSVGSQGFAALYQGVPRPSEGNLFKRSWFPIVENVPYDAKRVRAWDKGATEKDGDFTVGSMVAYHDGIYYVENIVRDQWSVGQRDTKMREIAEQDANRYKNSVAIWVEQEPGSGGKESAQNSVRLLAGFPVFIEKVTGDKEVRAQPFGSQAEHGYVRMVRGSWNDAFLTEFLTFPNGKHDDIVDATCMAFNKLALQSTMRPTVKVYNLRGPTGVTFSKDKKNQPLKIAVCTTEELRYSEFDQECLVVSIKDPDSIHTIPPHKCEKMLDRLDLTFADIDPNSDECKDWDSLVPPWNKKPEELIMTKKQGKELWSFLTRKRPSNPVMFVIHDSGGKDRRAMSLAMGICDGLYLKREKTIYLVDNPEVKWVGPPANKHVYQLCRNSRKSVI